MRVFIASAGAGPDDFSYSVAGELVKPAPVVCDRDLSGDLRCGCGRAWVGLASGRATSVAVVADRAGLTWPTYAELIGDTGLAFWLADEASDIDVGTQVRHRVTRAEPGKISDLIEEVEQ